MKNSAYHFGPSSIFFHSSDSKLQTKFRYWFSSDSHRWRTNSRPIQLRSIIAFTIRWNTSGRRDIFYFFDVFDPSRMHYFPHDNDTEQVVGIRAVQSGSSSHKSGTFERHRWLMTSQKDDVRKGWRHKIRTGTRFVQSRSLSHKLEHSTCALIIWLL